LNHVVLARIDEQSEEEFLIASKIIPIYANRNNIPNGSVVMGRYSVLPFYNGQYESMLKNGSILINTPKQHEIVSNMELWLKFPELRSVSPKTWFDKSEVPNDGPFVVKGNTNSRKHEWNTKMFAKSRDDLDRILSNLQKDTLIYNQGILFREYVKLEKIAEAPNELPISNEWRFFYWEDKRVATGFYWSKYANGEFSGQMDYNGIKFADKIASVVANFCKFFVVDIAKTEEGDWILIEIGDAQMAGLSAIDKELFYTSLSNFFI